MAWNGFTTENVFDSWDLNPLAAKTGVARDDLSAQRDQFLNPYLTQYNNAMGGRADATSFNVINSPEFQNFVRTGQVPQQQAPPVQQAAPVAAPAQAAPIAPAAPAIVAASQSPQQDLNTDRNSEFWQMLMNRATQGITPNANDPVIRAQADAYSAAEERARRGYVSDAAESLGPYATGAVRGQSRMAAERMGQRTGAFEADLLGREVSSRRGEVSQALAGMQGLLSGDQQLALQDKLGMLSAVLQQQGLGLQDKSLNQQNDQFLRDLGLRDWDRQMYWDLIQRGAIG